MEQATTLAFILLFEKRKEIKIMFLNYKEKRELGRALSIILKSTGSTKTNLNTIYQCLEMSNDLNMDEINNILLYSSTASPEDFYNCIVLYIKYENKLRNQREAQRRRAHEYYLKNKDKIREYKRTYAKRNYNKKKGN